MKKIGLALSGGGFRATLYHLGLARFLRDAGLLSQVTHITSVSGGSIFAAHLVLNWDRYNGSANEFDAVAAELLAFIRMDVRNRITRRFPLTMPFRWPRRLMGLSNRLLTRTGLLEYHYRRFLFGDTSLFQLPQRPMLHILATNLSEGCLCSFNRDGLLMMRRDAGGELRMHRTPVGLATVPMAVTASSAFPGFFPPIELTGAEVGSRIGEFGRQSYTDGGVFDNLGVRMFRCLERPLLAESPLTRDDFVDFPALVEAFRQAGRSSDETPLRRLAQILVAPGNRTVPLLLTAVQAPADAAPSTLRPASGSGDGNGRGSSEELLVASLGEAMRHHPLHREPLFAALNPLDSDAEALLRASGRHDGMLDPADQHWLNRHLLEAAFRQATGAPCFRRLNSGLDGVLVSDVGKSIEIQSNRKAGGLIRTALRASDILMERVWQLENETFEDTPGFVFSRVTDVVELSEDPTAPHPEIQRQAANIRTDLDRFSPLEISSLVRHGYCIGRKICRAHPELFGPDIPQEAPWDPTPGARPPSALVPATARLGGPSRDPSATTVEARSLQVSGIRRIWSTLFDWRDWSSYVYVPILAAILFFLPYMMVRIYQHSQRVTQLMESISQGTKDMDIMSRLLDGPMTPWVGVAGEEVAELAPRDFTGYQVLQDSRILDMRQWNPLTSGKDDPSSVVYGYRRLKILKTADNDKNPIFRIGLLATHPGTQTRFPVQVFHPKLRMQQTAGAVPGEKRTNFEMWVDMSKAPAGEIVDLMYEHYSQGNFLTRGENSTSITFHTEVDVAEVTRWFMMPRDKEYRSFRVLEYPTGEPAKSKPIRIVSEFLSEDSTILAYKLLAVKGGYTHEVEWFYK